MCCGRWGNVMRDPWTVFYIVGLTYLLGVPLCYVASKIIRAVRDARNRVRRTP